MGNLTDGQIWVLTGIHRTGRRMALLGRRTRKLIREEKGWVEHTYKTIPRYHHRLQYRRYTYAEAAMLEWWGAIPECLRPFMPGASSPQSAKPSRAVMIWPWAMAVRVLGRISAVVWHGLTAVAESLAVSMAGLKWHTTAKRRKQ